MAANTLDIPLFCNICPKAPHFSDVSHLLTHVGSKGHLSSYYKAKVRSATDASARAIMQAYDQWYSDYDIETLMADRMNIKDKKKIKTKHSTPTPSATGSLGAPNRASANVSRQSSVALSHSSYQQSPSLASQDHRLGYVKREPAEGSSLGSIPRHHMQNGYHGYGTPASRLPYGMPRRDSPYDMYGQTPRTFGYPEPPRYPNYMDSMTNEASPLTQEPTTPQYKQEDDDDEDNDLPMDADTTGTATLKGVYWPGMDIFDSATPMAKRRRNQKKDESVVLQLQKNSEDVEPTEYVHFADGTLKKKKEISGLPSSTSPFTSPAQPAWRPALTKIEPDTKDPSIRNSTPRYNGYTDDRISESLQHGYEGQSKKRNFDVFHDHDEPVHMPNLTRGMNGNDHPFDDHHTRRRMAHYQQNENARLVFGPYIKREEHDGDFFANRSSMSTSARLNAAVGNMSHHRDMRGPLHDPFSFNGPAYHPMHDNSAYTVSSGYGHPALRSNQTKNRSSLSGIPVGELLDGPPGIAGHYPNGDQHNVSSLTYPHGGMSNLTLAAPTPISGASHTGEWGQFWHDNNSTIGAPPWGYNQFARPGPNGHAPHKSRDDGVLGGDRPTSKLASTPKITNAASTADKRDTVPSDSTTGTGRGRSASGANDDDGRTITAPGSPCAA